jgi:hypothetical protein
MGWRIGKWKEGLFWKHGIPHKTGREPALLPTPRLRRRLSSCEEVPTPKIALIREKTALMFWDIPGSKPVWLSGTFSQRKITANSTYWKAKVVFDRPYLLIKEQNTAMGVGVFRDPVLGCCREFHGGEKIVTHTLPEGHLFLDLFGPD